ncbi:uncharacterized protein IL334_003145 [Kwoniella shivajii]|uniref:NudC domain-containing protein 1 n=1 Tax=Kwoniella shivajii TaxID=564305 RepID=A0ABZ1D0V1_9TREE|nr:hypothetical protein IL334_003145 [Kwoniella shivajii]
MSHLFPSDRSLLYPQFETYKLRPLDTETDLAVYPLPGSGATQSRFGYSSNHLSFKEVRSRISWDHLSVGQGARGVYVDKDWNVIGFVINEDLSPTFTKLASLPIPISSTTSTQQSEYPSVLPLTPRTWGISSGSGSLYILETTLPHESTFQGRFIARYDLSSFNSTSSGGQPSSSTSPSPSPSPSPFLLRASHQISDTQVKLLIARSIKPEPSEKVKGKGIVQAQLTKFQLIEINLNPTLKNDIGIDIDQGEIQDVNVAWILQSGDLPIYCKWSNDGWMILSSEQYTSPSSVNDADQGEAEMDGERKEMTSKSGLGKSSLSVSQEQNEKNKMDIEDSSIYPYKWTQDSDSINMIIPLPSGIKRQDLNITFTSSTFSISLDSSAIPSDTISTQLNKFLSKSQRSFWTTIEVDSSSWTFDPVKSQVEIDLTKIDENVRWPSIFSPSENDFNESEDEEEEDEDEDEVPETLSESTLAAVRESFNNIKTRNDDTRDERNEPTTNHLAMPALLREEMDFDLDDDDDGQEYDQDDLGDGHNGEVSMSSGSSKVGKEVFIGFIKDGIPTFSKNTTTVLSIPLSTSSAYSFDKSDETSAEEKEESLEEGIIIKSAVDGLLFSTKGSQGQRDITKKPWKHISTNPALAFVLSSKRDLRFTRHLTINTNTNPNSNSQSHSQDDVSPTSPSSTKGQKIDNMDTQTTLLAFDSGSSIGQGNLYVYYSPHSKTEARQGVIPVSGGDKGALLGVGVVKVKGKERVVILCENALVVLKGVI